jgi:hypothetical protein
MKKQQKQTQRLDQRQVQRQDLRLYPVLAAPEEDFLRQAAELEADPLFPRLFEPGSDGRAPLRRRRFPGASYAFQFACADEALAAAAGPGATAGEWLAARPAMLALARRCGAAAFETWFLSGLPFSAAAAARECGFSAGEAEALRSFVDAFILAHERVAPAALPGLYLRCAARVAAEGGRLSLQYTHPAYLRGGYVVDGEALARLLKSGALSAAEAARARALAAGAQRIGWRKAGFHRVLTAITERQKAFFTGGAPLLPLTQRELASAVDLDPGTVSRLISGKTVMTPSGEEIRLKDLFKRKNNYIIEKIKELPGGGAGLSDKEVAETLRKVHGIKISRRSVNLYRSRICRTEKN